LGQQILTEGHARAPSERLLEASSHRRKVGHIGNGRHAIAAYAVNLDLALLEPFGVQRHAHKEELHRTRNGDDANQALEAEHAAGHLLFLCRLLQRRVAVLDDRVKVPVDPGVLGELASQKPGLADPEQRQPPLLELALAVDLKVAPRVVVDQIGEGPDGRHGVDDGARDGHLRQGYDGRVAVGFALGGVIPGEAAHDSARHLARVGVELFGVEDERHQEALDFLFDVAVKVVLMSRGHGSVHPFPLILPRVWTCELASVF